MVRGIIWTESMVAMVLVKNGTEYGAVFTVRVVYGDSYRYWQPRNLRLEERKWPLSGPLFRRRNPVESGRKLRFSGLIRQCDPIESDRFLWSFPTGSCRFLFRWNPNRVTGARIPAKTLLNPGRSAWLSYGSLERSGVESDGFWQDPQAGLSDLR